jgi:Crp-like helix-turn-helix protein
MIWNGCRVATAGPSDVVFCRMEDVGRVWIPGRGGWVLLARDADAGSVRQRVAAHLLDLASAQQRPRGQLVARVSQQELADAVGSVREVVARVLRDFRVDRLVATSPESIQVLDPGGLHDQSWNPAGS